MEPRKEESRKDAQPRKEAKDKKRRFQIVKLEERIAPRYCYTCPAHGHHHPHYKP